VKGTRQGLKPSSYVFSLQMRNQGYVVLYKIIWKWFGKPFIFGKWTWQGLVLLLRISIHNGESRIT